MKKSKLIFALVLTFVMLLSSFAFIPWANVSAINVAVPGMTVNGVLNTDYYSLYPYVTNSFDIGFSMYGELINSSASPTTVGVGMQYPGYNTVGTYDQKVATTPPSVDPFANEYVPKQAWVNGWLVNITYRDPLLEHVGTGVLAYRNVWAFAEFSDGVTIGGGWNNYEPSVTVGAGGRQCNHNATTLPLQVLENDPRSFVAVATTIIWDNQTVAGHPDEWPLAEVLITINFNKDTKDVVLYKDVKMLINPKYIEGEADVELGDRGEWDMGPSLKSYSYIYPEWGPCSYGAAFANATTPPNSEATVMKTVIDTFGTPGGLFGAIPPQSAGNGLVGWNLTCPTIDNPFVIGSESVWVNGTYQLPAYDGGHYTMYWNPDTDTEWVTFPTAFIGTHSKVVIEYKNYIYDSYTCGTPDAYTLAQIIEAGSAAGTPGAYVGFAAYWPVLSDYTPYGWLDSFTAMVGGNETYAGTTALPNVAFLIGQWDTELPATGVAPYPQFRGVEEYGLTDWHDASNPALSSTYNTTYDSLYYNEIGYPFNNWLADKFGVNWDTTPIVDREVQYLLDAVFNPYNLNNAVEKDTSRWEILYNVTALDVLRASVPYNDDLLITLPYTNFLYTNIWDQYASFSERVLWNGVLQYPQPEGPYVRSVEGLAEGPPYYGSYYILEAGYAYVGIPHALVPKAGTIIEIQFSTYTKNYVSDSTNVPGSNGGKSGTGNWTGSINTSPVSISSTTISWTDSLGASFAGWVETSAQAVVSVSPHNGEVANGTTFTYSGTIFGSWFNHITVYNETPAKIGIIDLMIPGGFATSGSYIYYEPESFEAGLTVTAPPDVNLYIDHGWIKITYDYTTTYYYNSTETPYKTWYVTTCKITISYDYRDRIPGTYEWGIVGANAATVDSAGLSMVSAAFKDKEVEYGYAGADINSTSLANMMPFIMSKLSATYKDALGRSALRDNYCPGIITVPYSGFASDPYWFGSGTYWLTTPISSSDIIVVGGPLANVAASYVNDFTSANWNPMTSTITAWSCWSKDQYVSNSTTGFAVISTYLDENGTVIFVIWGNWGRDTYWATRWFQTDGIFELQNKCDFKGVTSLVLQINYKKSTANPTASPTNPTFNVDEVLGTISERLVVENGVIKGGIHPDP